MKVCGILDDLNQIVCLHQNYSCPINDIIFNQNQTYSIKINETIINYDNIKINDNLYIHYTNKNINKKIISSFNISFDKPCSHFYQNPKRSNIFIAHDFIHCNECNNTLFEYIYYENATKFMKDNNLYSSFQQFTSSKFNDYDVNLFSSFYFGLNKTCILEYNFNENSFKNYSSQFSIFKGFHIIFTVFYFILSFIMVIYANMFQGCKLIFALIHAIIFFFSFVFMVISLILITLIYSPFDCKNDNIDFIKEYKKMKKKAKISFIISILYLILCFIKIIFELYFGIIECRENIKKQKKEKEKEKEKIKTNLINSEKDSELVINLK